VFDGLRVSTEHVDHLQDSMRSSVAELREAVGLGRIVRPFAVTPDGDGAVVVGPGLAFDSRGERLTLDDPLRAEIEVPAGSDVGYLCLVHEDVEDGEVEGQPTLVFDSVGVVVRDALPGAGDEALAVARLVRTEDGFDIGALDAPPPVAAPALRFAQGVARLSGEGDWPVPATVGRTEIELPFVPASVSCVAHLSATAPEAVDGDAHGEVTFEPAPGARFGFTTTRAGPGPPATVVTDWGVAELPVGAEVTLLADVTALAPVGIAIECSLVQAAPPGGDRAAVLEGGINGLAWSAAIGWKATGT
jgi:hypothetical protein